MSANNLRPLAGRVDSRALYRAQRRADQPNSLFYLLLGLVSASRKTFHKAINECESMPAETTGPKVAPNDIGEEPALT